MEQRLANIFIFYFIFDILILQARFKQKKLIVTKENSIIPIFYNS